MNIRRTIFLLLALFMILTDVSAQMTEYNRLYYGLERPEKRVEMGITAGASYMFNSSSVVDTSPRMGVRASLVMAMCWHEQFALQGEVAYISSNLDISHAGVSHRVKSNIFEVPILFSYRGIRRVRINVGPVLNLASASRYSLTHERVEAGQLRSTVGYSAGLAVEISRHVVLDARYTGNFASTDCYFEGEEYQMRSGWAMFSIGYMF